MALRTLVISDLHLGARTAADVLRGSGARTALLEALHGCERLVLLGDTLELRHGPLCEALTAAQPVLEGLAGALAPGAEVVIVPGNHDHHLLRPWLERRGRNAPAPALGLEAPVDWRDGEPLAAIAGALARVEVRVAYPGVWLREDVYATHGHYGDRHTTVPILERLGAAVMLKVSPEPAGGPVEAEDYEATLGPMYAWLDAIAQGRTPEQGAGPASMQVWAWHQLSRPNGRLGVRRASLRVAWPALVAALNLARLGPFGADVSGVQLRRAGLRAFGEVLARLHVQAGHVIFGHTHRAGPLPRDDRGEWLAPTGARMLNTGSWVHEPKFLGTDPRTSPYRPGFCAALSDGGAPELVNLLDAVREPGPA